MVSSANFRSLTEGSLDVQSFVYREKSTDRWRWTQREELVWAEGVMDDSVKI